MLVLAIILQLQISYGVYIPKFMTVSSRQNYRNNKKYRIFQTTVAIVPGLQARLRQVRRMNVIWEYFV